MSDDAAIALGYSDLMSGRWVEARAVFERGLAERESPSALFGLAMALWWLGENQVCVDRCTRAYLLFRRAGDVSGAVRTAVWLSITYRANFGNLAAANGWVARAERLLEPVEPGPLHGWVLVTRAYRLADLAEAEDLTARAVEVARAAQDVDLELVAVSQLGLIWVQQGKTDAGFRLIDEAMAGALAGEALNLDTVVYASCDMLNACELVADLERASQWCTAADRFVDTYGCPFLYAECRIYYGSVLTALGRWVEAERELRKGLEVTDHAAPGLHARAVLRLAGLRLRQGRLEDAERLLTSVEMADEIEQVLGSAALALARGDAASACRILERRLDQLRGRRWQLASALHMLVDARLAMADCKGAGTAAMLLASAARSAPGMPESPRLSAMAAEAVGRVAMASGDLVSAVSHLESALTLWADQDLPYELARTRFQLARALVDRHPELSVNHARLALSTLDRLGAAADADLVAEFLRGQRVTPRTGVRRPGPLTLREREVLRLLRGGLSNPEIAERLHISRKTAEHHVSSILTKLGLRNRTQAAAHAVSLLATVDDPKDR
ncbi:MAG TPA: response regulator transcription factor [Microlunatus sp.]